jgi:serine/threonine protein phosphatase PrpC
VIGRPTRARRWGRNVRAFQCGRKVRLQSHRFTWYCHVPF